MTTPKPAIFLETPLGGTPKNPKRGVSGVLGVGGGGVFGKTQARKTPAAALLRCRVGDALAVAGTLTPGAEDFGPTDNPGTEPC